MGAIGTPINVGLAVGRGVGEGVCIAIGSDVGEIGEQPQGSVKLTAKGQS